MHKLEQRSPILNDLKLYQETWVKMSGTLWEEPKNLAQKFIDFVLENSDCFERTNLKGHITASGYVVDPSFSKVLLTHHRKLNDWLQLGGHADGDPVTYRVALKECQEESGLNDFTFVSFDERFGLKADHPLIFDLDCHLIPARKNEPEHYHYDVRYLLIADEKIPLQISEESQDLKWVSLKEAFLIAQQTSMHRPFKKIELLRASFVSN